MTSRKKLLIRLLEPLVEEWGFDEVETTLGEIFAETKHGGGQLRKAAYRLPLSTGRPSSSRPLASEQVDKAKLSPSQKNILQELAMRFDRKQFLPSISDAREFLMMIGDHPSVMKDRSEAFGRVLKALSDLSPERLEQLARRNQYTGISQLGPLSDAISAAATSIPRNRGPVGS